MLDKFPAPVRHSALMLIAALLTWLGEALPGLDLPPAASGIVGIVVTMGLAYLTPLTTQYGVGSESTDGE